MREINVSEIIPVVKNLCIEANYYVNDDLLDRLKEAVNEEESPVGKEILSQIIENDLLAGKLKLPMCQDTGVAVFFIELGQDVHIVGGNFYDAINEGVRQGYTEGYLRKSLVTDPVIERKNTKDNTPAIIHTSIVSGDKIKIDFAPKGGGSENMSEIKMMTAADGLEGVKKFVIDRVKRAGGNPCPPIIVGVGIGGDFEQSAILAKKAIFKPLNEKNSDPKWATVEDELLNEINKLGIGPMGLGGRITALAVKIFYYPCHIASMPVAVNIQCHSARHKSAII